MPFVAPLSGVDMPPRFWTIGSWCLSQSRASTEGHTHITLEQPIALFAANPEGAPAQWKGKRGGRIEKEAPRDWWTPSERREGTRGAGANAERKTGGRLLEEMVPGIVLPGTMSHAKKDPVHKGSLARIEL